MAYRSHNDTANWLNVAAAPVTAAPLTMSCWFMPLAGADTFNVFCITDTAAANDYFVLGVDYNGSYSANGAAYAITARSTEAFAISTTLAQRGRWNHIAAVFASSTDRRAFCNGTGKGTNATNRTPTSLDSTQIGGFRPTSTTFGPINGIVRDCCLWNVALTDAEIRANSVDLVPQGRLPRTRTPSIVGWWPCLGEGATVKDYSVTNRNHMTINGVFQRSKHPDSPQRKWFRTLQAPATATFEKIIGGGFSLAGCGGGLCG